MMSNLEMLERLTKGVEAIEMITVNGEEVEIRPLTSGELSELQTIEKKGFVMKLGVGANGKRTKADMSDIDINAGDFTHYQNEALYKAVAYGLSVDGEKIKPGQIQKLPNGVPEKIFQEIVRISNITNNDLTIIKNFRKEQ